MVIPTHNRAELLPRAVKSVQSQTRPVDEIIIVSDGSTDDTEEIVKRFAEEDERIRLIAYHPGHNGNFARNRGIEAATGEFIAFLDDDDEWLPKKTELQMALFEKGPGSRTCLFRSELYLYGYGSFLLVTSDVERRFIQKKSFFAARSGRRHRSL